MVDIQSKEVIDKISDELKIQPSLQIPRVLGKDIQLVYDVNPPHQVRIVEGFIADATTGSIFTTNATRRTFMIGAQLSVSKSVLSPATSVNMAAFTRGAPNRAVLTIRFEPVTAGQEHNSVNFSQPIELEPGTSISLNASSATASIDLAGLVYFYETDPQ